MNAAIEELYNYIQDHPGPEAVTPGIIENWFILIRNNQAAEKTKAKREKSFSMLTEGMAGAFFEKGYCKDPFLLDKIQKAAAEYIQGQSTEETPETAGSGPYLPVRPNYYTFPDSLLSQYLPGLVNRGKQSITTGRKKSKNPVCETVEITMLSTTPEGVTIEGNYTLFHEAVFNAFISLWLAGNVWITAQMIQHLLSQNYTSGVKEATQKEIENALDDMQNMNVKINMNQEAEKRGINSEDLDYFNRGAKMLNLDWCELSIGGHKAKAYTLYNPSRLPIIYEHALAMGAKENGAGEIVSKPVSVLDIRDKDTGKRLRATNNRVKIREYLFKQVVNMQRDFTQAKEAQRQWQNRNKEKRNLSDFEKMNHVISYDTLFQKTGLENSTNSDMIRNRYYIECCLATWQKAGEIKGYIFQYNGHRRNTETGVKILLD